MSCPTPNPVQEQSTITCPAPRQARRSAWELMLPDYLAQKRDLEQRRLEGNRNYYRGELRKLGPRATKKRAEIEAAIRWAEKGLDDLEKNGPTPGQIQRWQVEYVETVKAAISKGKPVSEEIVNQFPEFTLARTARQRYEKGRHTSFGNRSAAVNDSMQEQVGYKVKRQDGKAITDEQVEEIAVGVKEIEAVFGDMSDLFRETDLTIAHTSGKHPFLSTAAGLYSVNERTISMGVMSKFTKKPIPSLGHEWAHWLDHESGKKLQATSRVLRGNKSVSVPALSENDTYFHRGASELYMQARQLMNQPYMVKILLNIADGRKPKRFLGEAQQPTDEEKIHAEHTKVVIGGYYEQPSEIFARMVEQYMSTHLPNPQVAVCPDYTNMPGYWNAENWKRLEPLVEKEVQRRIAVMRGTSPEKANNVLFSNPWESRFNGVRITAYLGYGSTKRSVDLVQKPGEKTWKVINRRFNRERMSWEDHVFAEGIPSLDEARQTAELVIISMGEDGE